MRDAGLEELGAVDRVAELLVERQHLYLGVQHEAVVASCAGLVLECAHQKRAGARPTEGATNRDALGFRPPILGEAEASRTDGVAAGKRDDVDAACVPAVDLDPGSDALFTDEHLAPDVEAALELVGACVADFDHGRGF